MKKRILIALVMVASVGAVVYWLQLRRTRAAAPTEELFGNVDIREVSLGFRVPGRLREVLKEEGDAVHAGETLA